MELFNALIIWETDPQYIVLLVRYIISILSQSGESFCFFLSSRLNARFSFHKLIEYSNWFSF